MKAKTRDSTLPRRRSAPALALQSPRHRQRVIPDKRRAKLDHELKETARKFGPAMRALANKAECCEWQTGQRKGPCREVHCDVRHHGRHGLREQRLCWHRLRVWQVPPVPLPVRVQTGS